MTEAKEKRPYTSIREPQQKIHFQWQERDLRILKMLNRYRYLRTGQIKRLVFPTNRSIQSTRRRLKYLFHNGYVGRIQPFVQIGHGQSETAYYLEKAGADVLKHEFPELEIHWYRKSGKVRTTFLQHALDLSEFRINLEVALHDHSIVELQRFVADFELKAHTDQAIGKHRYKLFQELTHPVSRQRYVVYPDALIILKGKGQYQKFQRLYFLEIDRGTESLTTIRNKVIGYHLYQQMGIFKQSRSNSFQKYGKFSNFKVLLQTTSEKRVLNIRKALMNLDGGELVWVTDATKVYEDTILQKNVWLNNRLNWEAILKK